MRVIYAGRRICETEREAAREVSRISGKETKLWQISRALLWKDGFVNGVPVFAGERKEPGKEEQGVEAAGPERQADRARLLRIGEWYAGGIPPRWR
jgi:hypothetical protein